MKLTRPLFLAPGYSKGATVRRKEDPRDSVGCWKCWSKRDSCQVCAGVPADVKLAPSQCHAIHRCLLPSQLPATIAGDGEVGWKLR